MILAYKFLRLNRLLAIPLVRQGGAPPKYLRFSVSPSMAHCAPFHAALPYALRDFMPVFGGLVA